MNMEMLKKDMPKKQLYELKTSEQWIKETKRLMNENNGS